MAGKGGDKIPPWTGWDHPVKKAETLRGEEGARLWYLGHQLPGHFGLLDPHWQGPIFGVS